MPPTRAAVAWAAIKGPWRWVFYLAYAVFTLLSFDDRLTTVGATVIACGALDMASKQYKAYRARSAAPDEPALASSGPE